MEICQRRVLRIFFWRKASWKIQNYKEIFEIFAEAKCIWVVKSHKTRWIGHVMRMKNERIPRMLLSHSVGGRRNEIEHNWMKKQDKRHMKIEGELGCTYMYIIRPSVETETCIFWYFKIPPQMNLSEIYTNNFLPPYQSYMT